MSNEGEILAGNLDLLLENSALILGKPAWFQCRLEPAYLAYWGGGDIPLGVLLLLWQGEKMLFVCAKCGSTVHLLGLGSTPFGSKQGCWGICRGCGRWSNFRPRAIGGDFFYANAKAVRLLLKRYRNEYVLEREEDGPIFTWRGLKDVKKKVMVKLRKVEPVTLEQLVIELVKKRKMGKT
jgi:hypothetical protein